MLPAQKRFAIFATRTSHTIWKPQQPRRTTSRCHTVTVTCMSARLATICTRYPQLLVPARAPWGSLPSLAKPCHSSWRHQRSPRSSLPFPLRETCTTLGHPCIIVTETLPATRHRLPPLPPPCPPLDKTSPLRAQTLPSCCRKCYPSSPAESCSPLSTSCPSPRQTLPSAHDSFGQHLLKAMPALPSFELVNQRHMRKNQEETITYVVLMYKRV